MYYVEVRLCPPLAPSLCTLTICTSTVVHPTALGQCLEFRLDATWIVVWPACDLVAFTGESHLSRAL